MRYTYIVLLLGRKLQSTYTEKYNFIQQGTSNSSKEVTMGKGKTVLIQLLSTAGTGFFYTTRKNPRTVTRKLAFR